MEKIIFIDRDGVINVDPIGDYIRRWEDFQFEEGALLGLNALSQKGYGIIVVSNQAGVGDGVYPESSLWEIDRNMRKIFEKEKINFKASYYCLHGKAEGCSCRKPKTGLFQQAAEDFAFNRRQTFFIGDKATDIQAGKSFGLKTIFVRSGHGRQDEAKLTPASKPDHLCSSLKEAADWIRG